MRKTLLLFIFSFTLSTMVFAQQMTDSQVVEYLKQAKAEGKSQSQITMELMRQGVTQQQAERIRDQYMNDQSDASATTNNEEERVRKEAVESIPQAISTASQIYGHNLFTNNNLTFEPNSNLATPENYTLGPGDEVIIDIWGANENTIRKTISPDGNIQISGLGPVHLNGMTIKEANKYLQKELSKIYSGIDGNDASTQVKLTLGNIRSIQINIMGEVELAGTYMLSAFSTVFHALYRAGGINEIGTLRSIKVNRYGKTIADIDVYDLIMKGKMNDGIRLQEGDVINVSTYLSLVRIGGKVKRPMIYEMKPTETLKNILDYAGGFTGDAYKQSVRVIRKTGREYQVFTVDEMDYGVFKLEDGDEISVESILDRYENRVEIRGAVYRSGIYQLDGQVNTVKSLIKKADGLRGDAFMNRAVLNREKDNYDHEIIAVDLAGIMNGTQPDIPLMKNDVLFIPSIQNLKERQTVTIHGRVSNPGTFSFAEKMTVEDLVVMAGGLLEDAATVKVDITRRIKNPNSTAYTKEVGRTFTMDLSNNFEVGKESVFLEPFDEVYIRKSPSYQEQQNVTISGEVLFGGTYALQSKTERISTLIERAGGLTPEAYTRGARLLRVRTEEEAKRERDMFKMAQRTSEKDSIDVATLDISSTYSVGIDLEKAIKNPNSDYDIVLKDGDVLYIPQYINTIKISGAVMYPNTVLYEDGKSMKYYINQAGGFSSDARKRKVFVINLNGKASKLKLNSKKAIEPGSEIVVPTKEKKDKSAMAEIMTMASLSASLAAVVASIVRLVK
ncbi:MAG: SLBB domain-containing protein [Phocaeicola sp.]|nr:SLBB domain-containing protein [Phocaeicola sp.]